MLDSPAAHASRVKQNDVETRSRCHAEKIAINFIIASSNFRANDSAGFASHSQEEEKKNEWHSPQSDASTHTACLHVAFESIIMITVIKQINIVETTKRQRIWIFCVVAAFVSERFALRKTLPNNVKQQLQE